MIEVGDIKLIPEPLPKSGWASAIEQFVGGGFESCRVECASSKSAEALAATVTSAVKRAQVPLKVRTIEGRVYLVRK